MNLFRLLSFLLRLSKEMRFSRLRIASIAGAGMISGAASTSMIALITQILNRQESRTALLIGLFVMLCLVLPVFRFTSQVLLIDMTQKSLLAFRLRLARSILAAPLRRLEEVGPHRLLATLTNDISSIVDSAAMATARAAAARRLGVSNARLPKPAIKRRLTGARTMLATSASTGLVAGRGP
jgi:ABC-type siderophore export system fused ATPase/permease subunit